MIHLTIMAMGKIYPLLRGLKGLSDQFVRFPAEFSHLWLCLIAEYG